MQDNELLEQVLSIVERADEREIWQLCDFVFGCEGLRDLLKESLKDWNKEGLKALSDQFE